MFDRLLALFAFGSIWELIAVALALAYVVLAVKKNLWCWPAAILSSGIYVQVMFAHRLYMEAALNVFYVLMAVYGWWEWRRERGTTGELTTVSWRFSHHALAVCVLLVAAATNAWLLTRWTDAARPFVDSLITWSSVVATWMVARRVNENWLYWIVIDAVAAILYFMQGLNPTGLLFVAYTIIAIRGYSIWVRGTRTVLHAS